MSIRHMLLGACLLGAAGAARAEVVGADAHGFEVRQSVQLTVPTTAVYAALGHVGSWWAASHTYSGKSANMRLSLTPGGCFCERLPDGGGVEHMRVAFVDPGKRVVMTGSLGPLLYEATTGVMDIQIERIAGGSRLTMNYRAAGFAKGGAAEMAPLVDQVLAEQFKRLRSFAVTRGRSK